MIRWTVISSSCLTRAKSSVKAGGGGKYGDIIRDCTKLASLGTEHLPGVIAHVSEGLKPLQGLALQRLSFSISCPSIGLEWKEEDGAFGFFTASVSTHESTDGDERSEATLVAFATFTRSTGFG
jgi:hypothetical protein